VVLRRPRPEDVPALGDHVGTEAGWLSAPTARLTDPVALLGEYQAGWRAEPNRLGLTLVVADPATDRLGGLLHLVEMGAPGELWVSYGIAPELRGRGIAQRALRLICAWALSQGGYQQVLLEIAVDNAAGLRVAERCGFHRLRRERVVVRPTKQRYDSWVYALP
jgi:RimJ/RimL family protein N-acetyltransferase